MKLIGKILIAIGVILLTSLLRAGIINVLLSVNIQEEIAAIIAGIIYLVMLYVSIKLFVEKCLKTKLSEYGIPKINIKARWILIGLLLPLSVIATFLLGVNGHYVYSNMSSKQKILKIVFSIIVHGITAGFTEEMIFRGLIFHALDKKNRLVALFLPSILFAVLHIDYSHFNILSCALVIVAGTMVGVMFSSIVIESGSIWNSGIVHAIWNSMIIGNGIAIGTKVNTDAIISYIIDSKSKIITGGQFGIESSIIAIVGYILVSIIVFIIINNKKSNYNK